MTTDNTTTAEPSFEAALTRLETIVRKLEGGEASLEESINLYEQGVALKRQCEAKLAHAQARIVQIRIGEDGQAVGTAPFDA